MPPRRARPDPLPYCNTGNAITHVEVLVEDSDPHRAGELTVTIRGQRVIFNGPDSTRFDGSLADLCDLFKHAEEYARADAVQREAEAELALARGVRAEFEQRMENFNWFFDGRPMHRAQVIPLRIVPREPE